ncbi:hypothetical protein ACFYVR_19850 [Rhodococcus sp. NPDC003318]|uniref:hypothetical protein n=1 Tax=Rhodococcus sp. NPDC003318 TaxID=3364503 RepID=UPI0036A6FA2C
MILASAAVGWLAQTPGTPTGPEFGKASPVGLLIIVALLVGTVLLIRSMNKQLRKLPDTFEPEHPEADQAADEGTDRGGAGTPRPGTRTDPAQSGKTAEPPTQASS